MLFGTGIRTMILALAVRGWTQTAQIVRAEFLQKKNSEFVLASRVMGASDLRLIFTHILPNSVGPIITSGMMAVPSAIFTESFLAYIGLGTDVTSPVWGTLLYGYRVYLLTYPRLVLIPIAAICLLALFFHYAFDGGSLKGRELTIYD